VGLALEIHDLLIGKYAAGREKGYRFNRTALAHGPANLGILKERLAAIPLDPERRLLIQADIAAEGADHGG
jgi:hypothetical protein